MKCFEYNKKNKLPCQKNKCRYWVDNNCAQNCCINIVRDDNFNEDKFTLQDIGDLFKVTRMRICQIEKTAINKIKSKFLQDTKKGWHVNLFDILKF